MSGRIYCEIRIERSDGQGAIYVSVDDFVDLAQVANALEEASNAVALAINAEQPESKRYAFGEVDDRGVVCNRINGCG